eukprot:scaffold113337_cov30-Phaeocystis_antarctica.AAC.1
MCIRDSPPPSLCPKGSALTAPLPRWRGGMRDVTAKYATNLAAALERRQLSEAQVARCSAGAARWRFKSAA